MVSSIKRLTFMCKQVLHMWLPYIICDIFSWKAIKTKTITCIITKFGQLGLCMLSYRNSLAARLHVYYKCRNLILCRNMIIWSNMEKSVYCKVWNSTKVCVTHQIVTQHKNPSEWLMLAALQSLSFGREVDIWRYGVKVKAERMSLVHHRYVHRGSKVTSNYFL